MTNEVIHAKEDTSKHSQSGVTGVAEKIQEQKEGSSSTLNLSAYQTKVPEKEQQPVQTASNSELDELRQQLQAIKADNDNLKNELARLEIVEKSVGDLYKNTEAQQPNVDIDKLLEEKIAQREATNIKNQNFKKVQDALGEVFGDNSAQAFKDKALEIGLTEEMLANTAATSPDFVIGLFPAKKEAPQSANPSVNSSVTIPKSTKSTDTSLGILNSSTESQINFYKSIYEEVSSAYS